jgi:hypothetical protein
MCFWRVFKISRLGNPKEIFPPKLIAKSDKSGLHTHGYALTTDTVCTVGIRQIIPKAFADESFEMNQFDINLGSSDPYIEPLTIREVIDGTYDIFDLSFRFCPEAAGKTCLLRITCSQPSELLSRLTEVPEEHREKDNEREKVRNQYLSIPPTVLPIRISEPWKYRLFSLGSSSALPRQPCHGTNPRQASVEPGRSI